MKKGFKPLPVLMLLLFTLATAQAGTFPASGSLTATQPCPAYQSKRNQTNPDHATLAVGRSYPIIESDSASNPGWYRIILDGAQPRERWIEASCGSLGATTARRLPAGGDSCNQPDQADSYILAVSWQTAFCESHRSKPECRQQRASFTLHGLWPNKSSCGTSYGFCGEQREQKGSFCDLKPLPISAQTRQQLGEVMPSAAAGSCLERHEWHKHGSCQTTWDVDRYYQRAIQLTREFNQGAISRFMAQNSGRQVKTAQLFAAVDQALGANAHRRLQLGCDNGNLVDVYIALPRTLPANATLAELIQQTPERFSNRCGASFRVDAAGY